jgi:serine/threonine protein kinase
MNHDRGQLGFIAPEPGDLAPLFPGYEIHDLIATGGMGAVYRAVQKSLDRTVALKILPMEFSEDIAFCQGFEAEAKAMARLNHPNLIGVHDFGEVNGMLFIVMEFVQGKSIYHSANGVAIHPLEVIRLITGVCNGLSHAHENGILHRDIKPANILLTLQAEPKIGDFGLARPVERKSKAGEVVFGTPGYTAPEVLNAPETVDHRADLFSVGVLLHELLTGKLPAVDPRPASMICGCDPRFDAIIRRATHPLPANRYFSAKQIAEELQGISTIRPIVSRATMSGMEKSEDSRYLVSNATMIGTAKQGMFPPPQRARDISGLVEGKSEKLIWIGTFVVILIIVFSWDTFSNRQPSSEGGGKPTVKPAVAGSSEGQSDLSASSAGLQAIPPAQPPVRPSASSGLGSNSKIIEPSTEAKLPGNDTTPVYNATDLPALLSNYNQRVTVRGLVLESRTVAGGRMRILNFTENRTDSVAVVMDIDVPGGATDQKLQSCIGKNIQFSGIVAGASSDLAIMVRSLADLKIMEGKPAMGLE